MVLPSPGIGRHHIPISQFPLGPYGGFGQYNNPSLFSGLTSSLNNFTSNLMTYNWTSLGVSAGISLLSMFLPGSWSSGWLAGGATGSGSAGGSGRAGARTEDAITKDIKSCLKVSQSYDTTLTKAQLKEQAKTRKANASELLRTAKAVEMKDSSGKNLTFGALKTSLLAKLSTTVLEQLFKGKNDDAKVTAGDIAEILEKIKADKAGNIYGNLTENEVTSLLNSDKTAVEDVAKYKKEYQDAIEAEKMAEKMDDDTNLNEKLDKLTDELADKYSGQSNTRQKLENCISERDSLNDQLTQCSGGKAKRLQKKIDKLNEKIEKLQTAMNRANAKVLALRNELGLSDAPKVTAKAAAPTGTTGQDADVPTVQNGYQNGKLYLKGEQVDITAENLATAGYLPQTVNGQNVYVIDGKCYTLDGSNLVEITKNDDDTYSIGDKKYKLNGTTLEEVTTPAATVRAAQDPPVQEKQNTPDQINKNKTARSVPYDGYTTIYVDGSPKSVRACGQHSGGNAIFITKTGVLYSVDQDGNSKPTSFTSEITVTGTKNSDKYTTKFEKVNGGVREIKSYPNSEATYVSSEYTYATRHVMSLVYAKGATRESRVVELQYNRDGSEAFREVIYQEASGSRSVNLEVVPGAKGPYRYKQVGDTSKPPQLYDGTGNKKP